jgi:hypothetical protein
MNHEMYIIEQKVEGTPAKKKKISFSKDILHTLEVPSQCQ